MKLYLLIFIIFLIILFFYLLNMKYEYFDTISGSKPVNDGRMWGIGDSPHKVDNIDCEPNSICFTEDGFGIYNRECKCIISHSNSTEESPNEILDEEDENRNGRNGMGKGKNGMGKDSDNQLEEEGDLTGCYPNNTNFSQLCKDQNPNYGVKSEIPCNNSTSKVECAANYIGGTNYGKKPNVTPCMDKSDDFDTWCKYFNTSNVPNGFNVNSIGAKAVLVGKKGECYLKSGKPDPNRARAVCGYDHMDTLDKLYPENSKIGYNKFTPCLPLMNTNFVTACSDVLHSDYNKTLADQILGYDCNPGYGRAKCIHSKDKVSGMVSYDMSNISNLSSAANSNVNCNC